MKRLFLAASLALALTPALASASPSPSPEPQRHGHHDHRGRGPKHHHHGHPPAHHDNGRHVGWYKHSYRRGQRVPVVYLQPRYYVDYHVHRLPPPPHGYRWVRPYGDVEEYLLVQVATGLIMQVLGY